MARGDETATIPYLNLATIDLDATVDPQLPCQNAIQLTRALQPRHDVDVVEEREETFIRQKVGLD